MIVQSLRYRLTLLISGVALAVILLATTSTYVEMVHADIADATDRLRRVAPLVANLFGGSVPALRTMVGTVAGNPAVTAFLRDPRGRAEAARVALRPLLVPQAAIAGVELWDARGKRVLSEPVDLPVLSDASVGELSGLVRDSAAIVIGFISHDGGALHYSIIEKVTERGRLLGYLLQRRRLATSAQATVPFRDLIGADATMLVGNRRGDLWTDFTREAPVPPSSAMGQGAVARFQGHDGHDVLAMMAVIPGTPWSIVIELPIEPLLADVRAVLRQVVAGGVILLLLTAAAAWGLAGTITKPVASLVAITKALGEGDYGQRSAVERRDELGTLARAFNQMADNIAAARSDLEGKAAEVERSENRFRALIEKSADGITLIAADGAVKYQSPGAERISGRPTAERLGQSFAAVLHPDDEIAVRAAFAQAREEPGASRSLEARFRHADGTWHWAEAILTNLLDDPHVAAVVTNYRDVTERKQADAARQESEERFRQIAEHIKEAFYVIDAKTGRTLYMSPTWSDIWGRPLEDGYDAEKRLAGIHEDDRETAAEARARVGRGEQTDVAFRIRRPNGQIRWVRSRSFPVRDKAGTPYRYVGVSEDITELRQVEERFTQAQKMEAVGRLAGGIAHDFNNLLTVILAYAEMLKGPKASAAEVRESAQAIQQAGESAATLTRQLLAFSRKELVEPKVFALNDAVADTSKMLRRLIGEDVRLETKLGASAGRIRADRGQIEQVLTNLAVNARDAMPAGGLLSIETENATLDGEYAKYHPGARPGDYVLVTVSDTGVGMSPEVIARAFEPFFTTKEAGKGTGLGLATCHGIVNQASGHIAVYSEMGIGTTFRVYLPRVDGEAEATKVSPDTPLPRGGETILVVEDEPGVRGVCVTVLRGQGYKVLAASGAAEALNALASAGGQVDLLLTDVVMPGLGGRELAERARQVQPGIKVLFTSGYTDDVILQQKLIAHDVVVLRKPYTRATLALKAREVLDRRTQVREV